MKKNIILLLGLTVIPYLLCVVFSFFSDEIRIGQGGNSIESHLLGKEVLIEINGLYKSIDVEKYVLGVLPGTILADYDEETLKVQAILIRTNVLKEMQEKGTSDASDLSYEYLTIEDQISLFGDRNYEKYAKKFEKAVVSTAGQVIQQENSLIMALYHAVSIGKTAAAAEILGEDISYLQSVDSNQDVEAKHYMNIVSYTWEELHRFEQEGKETATVENETMEASGNLETTNLEENSKELVNSETESLEMVNPEKVSQKTVNSEMENLEAESREETSEEVSALQTESVSKVKKIEIRITESTENGFVKQLSVAGNVYTGEEAMARYDLPSSNFYVEEIEGGMRFVCLGKGNCMGVSQYGANVMAISGKTAEEIIKYYYKNVSLVHY